MIQKPITFAKGNKPEALTVIDICRGVVSGMLGDHYLGRNQNHYESSLRPHVLAVAQKRGFGAYLECKLEKPARKSGSHRKIDYVLLYGKQIIAIELKTIRAGQIALSKGDSQKDIKKLAEFYAENKQSGASLSGWFIVAWSGRRCESGFEDLAVNRLNFLVKVDISKVVECCKFISSRRRKMRPGEAVITSGSVGGLYVQAVGIRTI